MNTISCKQVLVLLPLAKCAAFNYAYSTAQEIPAIGSYVKVPFRAKEVIGVLLGPAVVEIDERKLKEIIEVLPLPPLPASMLSFIAKVAAYNMTEQGNILKMVMPASVNLKKKSKRKAIIAEIKKAQPVQLSPEQQDAVSFLQEQLQKGEYSTTLLDGVTGSGKTEVYFALIHHILAQESGQVVILLPEIVLTSQLIARFTEQFGFTPDSWHSALTLALKRDIWQRIVSGECRLIIGARSALFLPFAHLQLIIVDEEHDQSYKQEDAVLYQARDMAVLRGYEQKITVVLASATPSIETIQNVKAAKFSAIKLSSRFGGAHMPFVAIVDMKLSKQKKQSFISPALQLALKETLAAGKQAMLFLNRRGYAPLTLCTACGFRFLCPNCSSWLVHHLHKHHLTCHHCDYKITVSNTCPSCSKLDSFLACGPGVERIAEEVKQYFPQARMVLMTRDHVQNANDAENIVQKILSGNIDVIIGTQMVAKGHHFPNLALVGVIDADLGLAGGDLRATERTYQLLHQVSGRAGREGDKGRVLIQSYYPDNAVLKALAKSNISDFIAIELQNRQDAAMPPFAKLAAIIISGYDEDKVRAFAKSVVKLVVAGERVVVLGPTPAVIAKLRGRFRFRILVRASRQINIQQFLRSWLKNFKIPSYINFKIDIDPYNFF
jgi:primosomal protein N' (replication factor Y)